jgi:hypothetical protein
VVVALISSDPLGSACGPVIVPVFKTGGRQVYLSPVGSTPTRFRHFNAGSGAAGVGQGIDGFHQCGKDQEEWFELSDLKQLPHSRVNSA